MPLRILVVDDSHSMRSFMRRVVALSGLDVLECLDAGNGLEALALLDRFRADVILTDIHMPVMNGEEFVRRLAESDLARSIPVIVVSSDYTALRQRRLASLGACGYLVKPFAPEKLRDELERVLGLSVCTTRLDGKAANAS